MIKKIPNIAPVYDFNDISAALSMARDHAVIEKFALSLSSFLEAQCLYPVNSGVSAFYLILEALKEDHFKKEVILPAYTAGSLVVAVKKAGLKPVLCDISLKDFNLDDPALGKSISNDTLAVVPVHMFGIGMENILNLKANLPVGIILIEDCAQAFGSRVKNKPVGSFSDISFFSFNRGKNFPLYSGGCIQINSSDLSRKISLLCQHLPDNDGIDILSKICAFYFATRPYIYGLAHSAISCFKDMAPPKDFRIGKISKIEAGLGLRNLENIDVFLKARNVKGMSLVEALKKEEGLILPKISEDNYPVFNQLPVLIKDSEKIHTIQKKLWDNGLVASRVYRRPLHRMFEMGYKKDDFPNANYLADHLLALPVHHMVNEHSLTKMIEVIKENI